MKRAFITGAGGFIGAVLVRQLIEEGIELAVLQREAEPGKRLLPLRHNLTFIQSAGQSVRDFADALRSWSPDVVFHLGWAGVGSMHRNDAKMQMANVQFAVDLAELCTSSGVSHFIGAGSQAEYGPKNDEITEAECPRPTSLYGAAKLSAFVMTQRICEMAGVRHAWLRIFSTYGPNDNADWLIPSLIRQLLEGGRPKLTPCEQTWDYLHVEDVAAAFIKVAESGATGVFNLASGNEVALRRIVELIRDAVNPAAQLGFGELAYRPDQVMRMAVSIRSLRLATDWSPKIDMPSGIRNLVASIRELEGQE